MSFSFPFTKEKLSKIVKNDHIDKWFSAMEKILPEYEITTVDRVAAFIAQTAHESMNFTALRENLNYSAKGLVKTWRKRFPTIEFASRYAHRPEAIANRVYANRMGNGPESSGDGWKHRGRGLIQLTGKENQTWFGASIDLDIEQVPAYLETFEGAVQSACWFWDVNNLNLYVDRGDFDGVSDLINLGHKTPKVGDAIGYSDRLSKFNLAKRILK